jgi:hypothetical protein
MMIAITGPRKLTPAQATQTAAQLRELLTPRTVLLAGDAAGLDALARELATGEVVLYEVKQSLPERARFAERSTRMVKALAATGGTLHAWPNKPAPAKLKPAKSWPAGAEGSGTWGTIALAVGLGLRVELHPLAELGELPEWLLQPAQLCLI